MSVHVLPRVPRIESTVRVKGSLSHLSMRDEQILIYARNRWTIDGICIALGHSRHVVLAALRRAEGL